MSLSFQTVTKGFGSGEKRKTVLDNISFHVEAGEILFILGQSGMGKSVTLKHIVGLLKPDSGKILLDENDVTTMDDDSLAQARLKCGMVFQHPALLDSLSVFENVVFGLRSPLARDRIKNLVDQEIDSDFLRDWAIQKLALVHLGSDILHKLPSELSYGMQKRVSLARTLAISPNYLLFDEPTTGLDPITTKAVNQLIQELSQKLGVTSLVVSHDMGCALSIAHRILVLDQGRILQIGTPQELRHSPHALIRDFLREALETESSMP